MAKLKFSVPKYVFFLKLNLRFSSLGHTFVGDLSRFLLPFGFIPPKHFKII